MLILFISCFLPVYLVVSISVKNRHRLRAVPAMVVFTLYVLQMSYFSNLMEKTSVFMLLGILTMILSIIAPVFVWTTSRQILDKTRKLASRKYNEVKMKKEENNEE